MASYDSQYEFGDACLKNECWLLFISWAFAINICNHLRKPHFLPGDLDTL